MVDKRLNYGRHIIESFANKIRNFDNVVDIGAGSGDDLMIYKKINPKAKLFALEGYEPNISILRDNGITSILHNLEKDKFPFDNESIDIINANQILEHIKELFWVLHEILRTLKIGGYFVLGVPNLASLHNRLLLFIGKQPTSIQNGSAHVRDYTKSDILKFLKIFGGYELIDFKGSNFYPFPPTLAKPLARCLPNMAWSIFLLLKKTKKYNSEFIKWPIEKKLETNFYLGEK
ncbi:MAG: class I SAM-dependent methyltransferase [Candidatus Helarchaeota archaeon]